MAQATRRVACAPLLGRTRGDQSRDSVCGVVVAEKGVPLRAGVSRGDAPIACAVEEPDVLIKGMWGGPGESLSRTPAIRVAVS